MAPADDIAVFSILRESQCAECEEEIPRRHFLRMENERPLCLACADLGHLVYLPRGDAALTRRASKYSTLRAIVLRRSRGRGQYERQGVLVEEAALDRAEEECLADEELRERRRLQAAERRAREDKQYVAAFAERIGELFPGCPDASRTAIARHACAKYSGRVGRSAAAKDLEEHAVRLAVRAHVRHVHTRYDELLVSGEDRMTARELVDGDVAAKLAAWEQLT